jgi:hypothetical protein
MPTNQIGALYLAESRKQFIKARDRINHCLNQLDNADIWWTPQEPCNSIGIILQHVCGNLRQWVLAGVGGAPDTRNRPEEFEMKERTSKADVQQMVNKVFDDVLAALKNLAPESLIDQKRIQGFDASVLGAIYVAVTHLDIHGGQILYITRLRKGADYQVFWKPSTKEQGA